MMLALTELYGYAVFGDQDAILQRVTVGELRQTCSYAALRQRLSWAAVMRAGLPPFRGAAWQTHTDTSLDLMMAEAVLEVATEADCE